MQVAVLLPGPPAPAAPPTSAVFDHAFRVGLFEQTFGSESRDETKWRLLKLVRPKRGSFARKVHGHGGRQHNEAAPTRHARSMRDIE